jgi:L-amino acid N-acyltransferase
MAHTPSSISTTLTLRSVERRDLAAVAAIYNHYVLHSTCTFAEEPEGQPYWDAWLAAHSGVGLPHPGVVAEQDGQVVGWGSLSPWNRRCAYRFSVEDSVYVRDGLHRRGVGRALLGELVRLARRHGYRTIIAQIADDQAASEKLHEGLGFRRAGTLRRVGFKFDRWIDVSLWQLELTEVDTGSP